MQRRMSFSEDTKQSAKKRGSSPLSRKPDQSSGFNVRGSKGRLELVFLFLGDKDTNTV